MNLKILGYFLGFSKLAWKPPKCRNFRGPLDTCPVYPMVNAPLFRGLSPLCYFFNIVGKQGNEKVFDEYAIWPLIKLYRYVLL